MVKHPVYKIPFKEPFKGFLYDRHPFEFKVPFLDTCALMVPYIEKGVLGVLVNLNRVFKGVIVLTLTVMWNTITTLKNLVINHDKVNRINSKHMNSTN